MGKQNGLDNIFYISMQDDKFFYDAAMNFSPEIVNCADRVISRGHENKMSRLSASFMMNRTQLTFKNY